VSEAAFEAHLDGGGEVCCFQLIEHAKEFLGGITERAAAEEVALAAEAIAAMWPLPEAPADDAVGGSSGGGGASGAGEGETDEAAVPLDTWVFEPASSRFKQPRRKFDVVDDGDAAVEIFHGEILEDRKSRFQAHAARVTSDQEVGCVCIGLGCVAHGYAAHLSV
jgi:hypothetical protein